MFGTGREVNGMGCPQDEFRISGGLREKLGAPARCDRNGEGYAMRGTNGESSCPPWGWPGILLFTVA